MNRLTAAIASVLAAISFAICCCPADARWQPADKQRTGLLVETTIRGAPFTIQAQAALRQNGFVVLGDVSAHDVAAAYPKQGGEPPIFVTTDALLQAWFGLSRSLLASAEVKVFAPHLSRALPELTASAMALLKHDGPSLSAGDLAALRSAIVTLAVGERLIAGHSAPPKILPVDLLIAVDRQLDRIRVHDLVEDAPGEDYTVYTPRGHYADDPALTRYFQASLWLSRRLGSTTYDASAGGNAGLKEAIALAAVYRAAPVSARADITALNRARASLAGPANGLSTADFVVVLDRVLGMKWNLSSAGTSESIRRLRKELRRPAYATTRVSTRQAPPYRQTPRQTVSLLPGSEVPDSALFQATGNPLIPERKLPSGMEIAAALGSVTARREIRLQEPQFAGPVLAAVDVFAPELARDDHATVYSGWLNALATLCVPPPSNAPRYMRHGDAWRYEKLNTVLGGWSGLRHTFQLYAEHATFGSGAIHGYSPALVEANPAFFDTMASLADRLAGVLGPDPKLTRYAAECRTLAFDARLELRTGTLPAKEAGELSHFGEWLLHSPVGEAAMVADVATGEDGNILHAVLAAGGLYRAIALFEQAGSGREAAFARHQLASDYPHNFYVARRAIEASYRSFDPDTFSRLYRAYDRAIAAEGQVVIYQLYGDVDDSDPSESEIFEMVESRLRQLKPLLEAARGAGKPLHPIMDQFTGYGVLLAHQLVAAMPLRREETLRICLHVFDSTDIALEYLGLFPDGKGSGDALEMLIHGHRRITTDAEAMAAIRVVEPFVERGSGLKNADLALDVLRALLGHGAASDDLLGTAAVSANGVRAQFPGTRTAVAADFYLAEVQVGKNRPEAALAGIQKVLSKAPDIGADDPVRVSATSIAATARSVISAKHRRFDASEKIAGGRSGG